MLSPNAVDMLTGRNLRPEDLRGLDIEAHLSDLERQSGGLLRRLSRTANRLMTLVL